MLDKKAQVHARLDSKQLAVLQTYVAKYNMSQELMIGKKIDNLRLPKEKQVARIIYRIEEETTPTGWYVTPAQKVKLGRYAELWGITKTEVIKRIIDGMARELGM
ncbi:hypothetical protein SAMN02745136_00497 [Anaerocolumna jejuensis DSM 15929]|uniref:Uncharacterized protein n=1 Tax=Anaerocolumna jejuensis DSM 15929 TaxID=1121322 RepID=A0A1M6KLM6_9FIRM|nr:hypothetical protein [Anaerocolumna jejuensis]SHJ59835.1 hypothetical protein SAMN02745136_00497 [Anaerocolumna jejuensis DSM 15929]